MAFAESDLLRGLTYIGNDGLIDVSSRHSGSNDRVDQHANLTHLEIKSTLNQYTIIFEGRLADMLTDGRFTQNPLHAYAWPIVFSKR